MFFKRRMKQNKYANYRPRLEVLEDRTLLSVHACSVIAVPDSYTTPENTSLSVPAPGIFGNDVEARYGSQWSCQSWFYLMTGPQNGTSDWYGHYSSSNGSFTYTPAPGFVGVDAFAYGWANQGVCVDYQCPTGYLNYFAPSNVAVVTINVTANELSSGPNVSINDVTVAEGNSGTVSALFTISLSAASDQTVTVSYNTADYTAKASEDYSTGSGSMTFNPGQTSQAVAIPVVGDIIFEQDQQFLVNLSNPTNANIADGQGIGTITNDDSRPTISISDVSEREGDSGQTGFIFTLSLSHASEEWVSVNYATVDGTAKAGTDYQAASGTVWFSPRVTVQTITVWVNSDTVKESNEAFYVDLTGASNATIADGHAVATILNDDNRK